MAVYSMKSGNMEAREELLEASNPEETAEQIDVEIEKFDTAEQLRSHLMDHYRETGERSQRELDMLIRKALMHFKDALEDREQRVIYSELEE